jgi:hypothetical protein
MVTTLTPVELDESGGQAASSPGVGLARMIVLVAALALSMIGGFAAYFAVRLISATNGAPVSGWGLVFCVAVPLLSGVTAAALSLSTKTPVTTLVAGFATLIVGAALTVGLVLAVSG